MGVKLTAFYAEADKLGGMHLKLQLAGETRMTSTQAQSLEDTPELIAKFEKALKLVAGSRAPASAPRDVSTNSADPASLRKHIQVYLDLMTQRALVLGNVEKTVLRVDEAAAEALDCARVSVWWIDPQQTKISCVDLFERTARKHSSGTELFAKDFPPYFAGLKHERTIAANDAHRDPRTSCFSTVYLKPLGINSMLDVPIWANGRMIGVVCHEHVGPARSWNADEEKFAYLMSAFVSLAFERNESAPPSLPPK